MKQNGFTLIELMVVIAVISILVTLAIPAYQDYTIRAQVAESFTIVNELKPSIRDYYTDRGKFPENNLEAGVPAPEHLLGNYISQVEVVDGAIHVQLGNYINTHVAGQTFSIRPIFVTANPTSPISWVCGGREAPDGMTAAGENRTDIVARHLPSTCR